MHSMLSFFLIAAMAMLALAAPTPKMALNKRTFSVPVRSRFGGHRSPSREMLRTFGKYGWEIIIVNPDDSPFSNPWGGESSTSSSSAAAVPVASSTVAATASSSAASAATTSSAASSSAGSTNKTSDAAAATTTAAASATSSASGSGETGDVVATPEENESEYLEKVTIGGQSLVLDFDTGSSDLWVFSSDLSSSESSGHTVFDPSQSTTWSTMEGGTWNISYGDGSGSSGTVGFDKVTIGGVTATKQAVEIATAVSKSFVSDTNNDGLVGLGFSAINTVEKNGSPSPQSTFFENVMDSLEQPVFTANLEDDASGTYTFGTIDTTQYTGDIHFTTIDKSNGFWQFGSPSYSIGGTKSACTTCSIAIADTGTSLILLDDDIVTAYYSQVDGASYDSQQGGYVYSCSATLPELGVAIGSDYIATIKGADMTYADLGTGSCFGGLQSNEGQGIQILGDMLLKQYFAVFDGGNETFGLATKA